jgi:hypothetical protein
LNSFLILLYVTPRGWGRCFWNDFIDAHALVERFRLYIDPIFKRSVIDRDNKWNHQDLKFLSEMLGDLCHAVCDYPDCLFLAFDSNQTQTLPSGVNLSVQAIYKSL